MEPTIRSRGAVWEVDAMADGRWDAYVRAHPRGSAYHLAAWAGIARGAYGFRPCYLALGEDDALRGVLPLFYGRGLMSGRRLTSMPIARAAGPLGDTPEDEAALLDAARGRLAGEHARQAIVQSTAEGYERAADGWSMTPDQPTWRLALPGDREELRAAIRRSSQNVVRGIKRAEKAGVTVRESGSREDLGRFYDLYLGTMRKHRALPRTLRQLELTRRALGPSGVFRLFLAELDGEVVAGGVFHAFGDTLELLYNASDESQLDARPNHALYSNAMGWAIDHGLGWFDFGGAVEGTSLATFKAQWGAAATPIYRYTASASGPIASPSDSGMVANRNEMGAEGSRLARVWERAPLALTRLGGALVYRYL
jgi:hypothetical protein